MSDADYDITEDPAYGVGLAAGRKEAMEQHEWLIKHIDIIVKFLYDHDRHKMTKEEVRSMNELDHWVGHA